MENILWYLGCIYLFNFICTIPIAFIYKKTRVYGEFPEINEQYPSFCRPDMKRWNVCLLFVVSTLNFGPIRFILAYCNVFAAFVGLTLITSGFPRGQNIPLGPVRNFLSKILIIVISRSHVFWCGVYWIHADRKKEKCYKKYLGPDWKPRWDGAGI